MSLHAPDRAAHPQVPLPQELTRKFLGERNLRQTPKLNRNRMRILALLSIGGWVTLAAQQPTEAALQKQIDTGRAAEALFPREPFVLCRSGVFEAPSCTWIE